MGSASKRPRDADLVVDDGCYRGNDDSGSGGGGVGVGVGVNRNKILRTDGPPSQHDAQNGLQDGLQNGHGHGDFSGPVSKKRSGGSTRTGQACDRCKVRKIRCDARLGGCSPCLQNNTECKTTDRITGRATARGHAEILENENAALKTHVMELLQQLRDNGIDPKAAPTTGQGSNGYASSSMWNGSQGQQTQAQGHPSAQPDGYATSSPDRGAARDSPAPLLPDFRAGCIGDNYLGVSSENNWLSPIEGTSLALFGTKIDLAEFMPDDNDPEAMSMSYRTFLNHAFGRSHPFRPELPSYEQCKTYAEWYFRSCQLFVPILHKPDFMRLIDRIHNESYQPRACESVMVHMVLAVMNFQFSMRNANEQARQDSMSHYHYACSMIPDLITGHTLGDIQALTLICSQLRNQPRPGAAWMFTNMVLGLAIESGLHRSAKAWQNADMRKDPHHLEMRKRTFWSLLVFHVHISGKLGRPMPLRLEDFDIEMPEAIPDSLPEEAANPWKECSFRAGIEGFKLLKIMMNVYSSIYSVKSSASAYETTVKQLEKELDTFRAQVPPEFCGGPQTRGEDRVSALYIDMSVAECQLMLHHPSLCPSTSPQVMSKNLDICLHWSNRLLQCAVLAKNLKALDTTWFYSTDFMAAIFTTLFAHTQRRDEMTMASLQRLRHDMDQWHEVMVEVGSLIGATPQLAASLKNVADAVLENIHKSLAAKTASAAVATTESPTAQDQPHPHSRSSNGYSNDYSSGHSTENVGSVHTQAYMDQPAAHTQHFPTLSTGQYGYASQSNGAYLMNSYNGEMYHNVEDSKPTNSVEDQLVQAASLAQQQVAQHTATTNFMTAFQSPQQTNNGFHHSPQQTNNGFHHSPVGADMNAYSQLGPAAWRHFADSTVNSVGGQDYSMNMTAGTSMGGGMHVPAVTDSGMSSQPWPLMRYNSNNNGSGGH